MASFFFQKRVIFAQKNKFIQEMNGSVLSLFRRLEKEYLSSNNFCHSDDIDVDFDQSLYMIDVLNCLKLSGLSIHNLVLKVSISVMLLMSIDHK